MSARVFTDRSRIETAQRCKRQRWLEYHEQGTGITPVRKPLPLAVGGSVHKGLEHLLRFGVAGPDPHHGRHVEDAAVTVALADFATHKQALDLPDTESAAIPKPDDAVLVEQVDRARGQFDEYLWQEQASLVEALVRAYARRRLRPLLEQFVVLEVEREGSWLLSEWAHGERVEGSAPEQFEGGGMSAVGRYVVDRELWFMSRPDALLLERESNQLYLLSFKTTGGWDTRKARDAEHDMQGLSEGVEVERRLADWWQMLQEYKAMPLPKTLNHDAGLTDAMWKFLEAAPAPPRILGIRYEYMLKGDRWRDKELSARYGFEARSQRSQLVRGYLNAGMAAGDEQWNWSWDYLKPDAAGSESKLNYRAWASEPVWTHMPIAKWIDMLDDAAQLVSPDTGAELGYKCDAQATGTTREHPLDSVFLPPMVVYRSEDDLRDWIEQVEAQEVGVAEAVAQVNAAGDENERRSQLNRHFGQTRRACSYPTECVFTRVCYGGEEIRRAPLESGLFKPRTVNHPQELEGQNG